MKHGNWQINVQYRIFNSIIKEQIFPQGMLFNEFNHCVEIQYKGQVLQLNKIRKSAMQRYEFLWCDLEMDTLEQLLEC